MVENNIKSETELFGIADEQENAVKKNLKNFVLSHSTKALSDLHENTRKMGSISKNLFIHNLVLQYFFSAEKIYS